MSKLTAKNVFYNIIENTAITLVVDGKSQMVVASHENFEKISKALCKGEFDKLPSLLDTAKRLDNYMQGGVEVKNGGVYYNGVQLEGVVVNKLLSAMKTNKDYSKRLVNFIDKLYQNPSMRSVTQLYSFMEVNGLTIAEDGDILAYKAVRSDYMSKTACTKTGERVDNSIGKVCKMPRNMIDDNPDTHCSQGLHAGALEYVKSFGSGSDKTVIVKINPKDVVSVPNDCKCQKMRVCEYTVISDYKGEMLEFEGNDEYPEDESGAYSD